MYNVYNYKPIYIIMVFVNYYILHSHMNARRCIARYVL